MLGPETLARMALLAKSCVATARLALDPGCTPSKVRMLAFTATRSARARSRKVVATAFWLLPNTLMATASPGEYVPAV